MQVVSNDFIQGMKSKPYVARITPRGGESLQGDVIKEIVFRGGANSADNTILLGSAYSGSVEITLDRSLATCAFENEEITVELGMVQPTGVEWLPMGKYVADNPVDDEGTLTVIAHDVLSAKLDVDFEPIAGFDFSTDAGVSSVRFWTALCARRGVETDIDGLTPIPLKVSPEGFTERQIIGFLAALYGGFAYVDRSGVLRLGHYQKADVQITPDEYYSDGLEQASYSFKAGWLKCYNELADVNMFVGDFDAEQGINLQSIWMTQEILNGLWKQFEGFSYKPVSTLSFIGNPLLDPGDIVEVTDAAGAIFMVPAMTLTHEYDGGLVTSITACGQAVTKEYTGPTRKAVARGINAAKSYADQETAKLDQLELLKRLTKNWIDDGIYLTDDGKLAINASALLTGILASVDGKIVIDLNGGSAGPVFNTGISTNGITIRGDKTGEPVLMDVAIVENGNLKYAQLRFFDSAGNKLISFSEDVNQTGGGMEISNDSGTLKAVAQATNTSAGFRLLFGKDTVAYLAVDADGYTVLKVDEVNCTKINGNTV